jgi:hypothetical protein
MYLQFVSVPDPTERARPWGRWRGPNRAERSHKRCWNSVWKSFVFVSLRPRPICFCQLGACDSSGRTGTAASPRAVRPAALGSNGEDFLLGGSNVGGISPCAKDLDRRLRLTPFDSDSGWLDHAKALASSNHRTSGIVPNRRNDGNMRHKT